MIGYSIDHGRHDIALAEHRSGGAPAFRCPQRTFDAVTEVLDEAPESVKFNWIHEEVQVLLNEFIPDYQVRVATRFLVHAEVLKHARARFSHDPGKGATALAKKAWRKWDRMTKAGETPA